jgi:enolase
MSLIKALTAREILDSRGNPTIEVDVLTDDGFMGRAAVPSGASTGAHEACELRDLDQNRYLGKGVLKAVQNVKEIIAKTLIGKKITEQVSLDQTLKNLDGTPNKSRLGANAVLGVSLACARAAALSERKYLHQYVAETYSLSSAFKLPVPMMNVLNGGAHANNGLDVQEFMIICQVNESFSDSLRAGSEIFHHLKKVLNSRSFSTAVGDEGGFAPKLSSNEEALKLLCEASEKAGYELGTQVFFALDVAATELFAESLYRWQGKKISPTELMSIYKEWCQRYPLISIEDGFAEDDWDSWKAFTAENGSKLQLVGDDLFVTNAQRLQRGIQEKAANALLVKVNQIGSLSETVEAVKLAQSNQMQTVMSHRSGETEDSVIADLAVGLGCSQIKTGSLCRSDRTAKYNQLLRIQEVLVGQKLYWGKSAFSR